MSVAGPMVVEKRTDQARHSWSHAEAADGAFTGGRYARI